MSVRTRNILIGTHLAALALGVAIAVSGGAGRGKSAATNSTDPPKVSRKSDRIPSPRRVTVEELWAEYSKGGRWHEAALARRAIFEEQPTAEEKAAQEEKYAKTPKERAAEVEDFAAIMDAGVRVMNGGEGESEGYQFSLVEGTPQEELFRSHWERRAQERERELESQRLSAMVQGWKARTGEEVAEAFEGYVAYFESGGSEPDKARAQAAAAVRDAADRMGDRDLHRDLQAVLYGEMEIGTALANVEARLAALPAELRAEGLRPSLADALLVDGVGAVAWVEERGLGSLFAEALGHEFRNEYHGSNPHFVEALPQIMTSTTWRQWEGRRRWMEHYAAELAWRRPDLAPGWLQAIPADDDFRIASEAVRKRYESWGDPEGGQRLVEEASAGRRSP